MLDGDMLRDVVESRDGPDWESLELSTLSLAATQEIFGQDAVAGVSFSFYSEVHRTPIGMVFDMPVLIEIPVGDQYNNEDMEIWAFHAGDTEPSADSLTTNP